MPTQIEKIVMRADMISPENFLPNTDQSSFGPAARLIGRTGRQAVSFQLGKRLPGDFSVGGEWHRREGHERDRNHVLGQVRPKMRTKRLGAHASLGFASEEGR